MVHSCSTELLFYNKKHYILIKTSATEKNGKVAGILTKISEITNEMGKFDIILMTLDILTDNLFKIFSHLFFLYFTRKTTFTKML